MNRRAASRVIRLVIPIRSLFPLTRTYCLHTILAMLRVERGADFTTCVLMFPLQIEWA